MEIFGAHRRMKMLNFKDQYDQLDPDYYFKAFNAFPQRYWHRRRMKQVIRFVGPVKSKRVLDIGGNAGILGSEMQNGGADVVVLDVSKPVVHRGKTVFSSMEFVVADGQKLPFKEESFDLVTCLETLEHAPRPWRICEEAYRILKKTGEFVALVPNDDSIPLKIIWHIWTSTLGKRWRGLHVHMFSPLSMRYFLSDFQKVTNDGVFHNMLCLIKGSKEQ